MQCSPIHNLYSITIHYVNDSDCYQWSFVHQRGLGQLKCVSPAQVAFVRSVEQLMDSYHGADKHNGDGHSLDDLKAQVTGYVYSYAMLMRSWVVAFRDGYGSHLSP